MILKIKKTNGELIKHNLALDAKQYSRSEYADLLSAMFPCLTSKLVKHIISNLNQINFFI